MQVDSTSFLIQYSKGGDNNATRSVFGRAQANQREQDSPGQDDVFYRVTVVALVARGLSPLATLLKLKSF